MKRFLTCFLISGLLILALPEASGFAQSRSDWREVLVRISELEGKVEALRRDASSAASGELEPGQRALLADMEVRIGQLESEIRTLTGKLEEIAYKQGRLEKDFDLFRRDVDLRFQDLKTGEPLEGISPELTDEDQAGAEEQQTARVELPEITLPEAPVAEQYDYAFSFLRRGDFASAEAAFLAFLAAHPAHSLAGNAQYWLGETYYVRQDFPEAAAAFLKGFQNYGEGSKGPDSLLKLGMSLASMNQNQQACSAFEELLSRYPDAGEAILNQATAQQERLGCT